MHHYSHYSLKPYNTFHIEAFADDYYAFDTPAELKRWLIHESFVDRPVLVMGGGSNLLFAGDFHGTVIAPRFKGMSVLSYDGEDVLVKVAAGEEWDWCVEQAVNQGYGGIENLSLIPGHVGAAPVQNIGAYGVEVQDVIEYVEGLFLSSGESFRMSRKECSFGYRYSIFKGPLKNKVVITQVVLRLKRKPVYHLKYGSVRSAVEALGSVNVQNVRKAIVAIREAKLPNPEEMGNAGSFFKNPVISTTQYRALLSQWPQMPGYPDVENDLVKVPAGWLIEEAGWKGKSMGFAGVHKHQALVLVNCGGATGNDLLQLAQSIEDDVLAKFSIRLDREVNVLMG